MNSRSLATVTGFALATSVGHPLLAITALALIVAVALVIELGRAPLLLAREKTRHDVLMAREATMRRAQRRRR